MLNCARSGEFWEEVGLGKPKSFEACSEVLSNKSKERTSESSLNREREVKISFE
jgi:hypothetical protein